MKFMALNETERIQTGFTHKVSLKAPTDTTAAAVTQIINILPTSGSLTAGLLVVKVALRLITPFTGGAVSACVLDIGDGGAVGRHIANANTDLFTALATNTKPHVAGSTAYVYTPKNITDGFTAIQAKFTTTTANVVALTAGEVEIYLQVIDLADFVRPNSFP